MSASTESEMMRFQRFVAECVASGEREISPEETVDLWRAQNPRPEGTAETVAALREALEDIAAGDRGVSLEEFDEQFRRTHAPGRNSA